MSAVPNPWTNVYGVGRSLAALCTLVALAADSVDLLFRPLGVEVATFGGASSSLVRLSLFALLSGPRLELARWLAIAVLALVVVGWRPRFTAIPHWWVTTSFAASSVMVEGGDQVAAILSLLLLPVALTDPRRWHWEAAPPEPATLARQASALVAASSLTVIRLQVAAIYFVAGTAKLAVTEWANGTALYYWLSHPVFGLSETLRPVALPLLANPWAVILTTWSVLVLEAALFMGLAMRRRYRPALLVLGLLFHFGIIVCHGLFTFFLAMAAALILYLRPVDEPFPWPARFRLHRGVGAGGPRTVLAAAATGVSAHPPAS